MNHGSPTTAARVVYHSKPGLTNAGLNDSKLEPKTMTTTAILQLKALPDTYFTRPGTADPAGVSYVISGANSSALDSEALPMESNHGSRFVDYGLSSGLSGRHGRERGIIRYSATLGPRSMPSRMEDCSSAARMDEID